MKRRSLVFATTAAAATAAGVGGALWRRHSQARPDLQSMLWRKTFAKPGGGELRLSAFLGHHVLLNFWATWCGPCITELPLLDRFHRDQQTHGWQVIGLAVDNDAPVQAFLAQRPVSFPVGLAGFEGVSLARALGNSGGGLPFSVVFDTAGVAKHQKLGAIAPEDLTRWAESIR